MYPIRTIRRLARITLAGLAAALVAVLAGPGAAFAVNYPPPGPASRFEPVAPAVQAHTHAAVTGGMAGWQIILIAAAALLAATLAVLAYRMRAARGRVSPRAA